MASLTTIKDELMTIVQAVQYSGDTAFYDVTDHPVESIDGYPHAVVVLADGSSDFETNRQNQRIDIFDIYILVSLEDDGLTMTQAYERVYDLMDSVRDALDSSQDFSGTVLYINPSSAGIAVTELQNGQNVVGTVRAEVRHLYEV